MSKKVYILMATYNGEKFITEQIDSILNQTYQNWKLIIHDDGSKDDTIKIIKKYVAEYPHQIYLIDDGVILGGAFKNFNYLLQSIDGNFDYLMFSDQDDIWMVDKIEMLCVEMLKHECTHPKVPIMLFTDSIIVDAHLNQIAGSRVEYVKVSPKLVTIYDFLLVYRLVPGCVMLFNKKLWETALPLPEFEVAHDWWINIVAAKKGKVFFLNKKTILYRKHNHNTIGIQPTKWYRPIISLLAIRKLRRFIPLYNETLKISQIFNEKTSFIAYLGIHIRFIASQSWYILKVYLKI